MTGLFDVAVVGGGPAGLNAALMLGRARRQLVVCDAGTPRNAASHAMHGFLSRDGSLPAEFLAAARAQLARYDGIHLREANVAAAAHDGDHFVLRVDGGEEVVARRLLLATGLVDVLPLIDGLAAHWGRGVFHCPYCDGWEVRDQPLVALGNGRAGFLLALQLTGWSRDLVLCTNGPADLDEPARHKLSALGITLREDPIVRLEGTGGTLARIVFASGPARPCRAAFVHAATRQASELPRHLGCSMSDDGIVLVNDIGQTDVPGVYAAGDMARRPTQPIPGAQVIIAAASGVAAAVGIDIELRTSDAGVPFPFAPSRTTPGASAQPSSRVVRF